MNEHNRGRVGRLLAAGALVGVAALVLPTWAQAEQDTAGDAATPLETVDGMVDEYRAALNDPTLEFPAGVELPTSPVIPPTDVAARSSESRPQFETGFGEVEAADVWRCAWQVQLIEAVNSSRMMEAEEIGTRLEGYYDLPAVQRYVVDPGRFWFKDVITPALNGDLVPLTEDLKYNCNPDVG